MPFERAAVIFGNLLDNVLEACRTLPAADRSARLALGYADGNRMVRVENAAPAEPAEWRDGLPRSTKGDRLLHGIGLRSVRKAVEPGLMEVYWADGTFTVALVLYDVAEGRGI